MAEFPWEAIYRSLVKCIGDLTDQHPVSSTRLMPEMKALAKVHREVLELQDRDEE